MERDSYILWSEGEPGSVLFPGLWNNIELFISLCCTCLMVFRYVLGSKSHSELLGVNTNKFKKWQYFVTMTSFIESKKYLIIERQS